MAGQDNDWLAMAVQWLITLAGMFLVWQFIKRMRPTLSLRGWGSLRSKYGFSAADLPSGLDMRGASVRLGMYKTDMAQAGLDAQFLYLRRPFGGGVRGMLRIPLSAMRVLEAPRASGGLMNLPVAGIFDVDGVEIWIETSIAEKIVERLH